MFSKIVFFLFITLSILSDCVAISTCKSLLAQAEDIKSYSEVTPEEFYSNPKFDGSVPFPLNHEFRLNFTDQIVNKTYRLVFKVSPISSLGRRKKALIKDLKRRSITNRGQREMGAMIAEYTDGTIKTVKVTSNLLETVLGVHQTLAVNNSGLLVIGKQLKRFTHIHTHPDPRLEPSSSFIIIPNSTDLITYINLRRNIRNIYSQEVEFVAIVAPQCEFCSDVVFKMDDNMLDKFHEQ